MKKKVLSISESEARAIALEARQAALKAMGKHGFRVEAGQTNVVITQECFEEMCREIDAAGLQVLRETFVITEE